MAYINVNDWKCEQVIEWIKGKQNKSKYLIIVMFGYGFFLPNFNDLMFREKKCLKFLLSCFRLG